MIVALVTLMYMVSGIIILTRMSRKEFDITVGDLPCILINGAFFGPLIYFFAVPGHLRDKNNNFDKVIIKQEENK